jgi:hypothetical protein
MKELSSSIYFGEASPYLSVDHLFTNVVARFVSFYWSSTTRLLPSISVYKLAILLRDLRINQSQQQTSGGYTLCVCGEVFSVYVPEGLLLGRRGSLSVSSLVTARVFLAMARVLRVIGCANNKKEYSFYIRYSWFLASVVTSREALYGLGKISGGGSIRGVGKSMGIHPPWLLVGLGVE